MSDKPSGLRIPSRPSQPAPASTHRPSSHITSSRILTALATPSTSSDAGQYTEGPQVNDYAGFEDEAEEVTQQERMDIARSKRTTKGSTVSSILSRVP